jgi:dTDP-4-amino-4,6-dideoxygalactose transaminase
MRSGPKPSDDAGRQEDLVPRVRRALNAWERSGGGPTSSILGSGAIEELERRFPHRMGVAHGLALPSATLAMRAALLALDVGRDDEVIVPAWDWIAPASATRSVGAVPVAADITLPDCFISPKAVARVLSADTKAVIVTHLLGVPGDVSAIRQICDPLGISVIEDCAQSLGASFDGKPVGSIGAAAVISFGPNKVIDAGGGGMIVTNDQAIWRRAVELSQHPVRQLLAGISVPNLRALETRIHPVAALVALHELQRVDARLAERHRIIEHVKALIEAEPGVETPSQLDRRWCVGAGLPVRVSDPRRLRTLGVLGLVARPISQQLIASRVAVRRAPTPMAELANQEVVCLTSNPPAV